MSHPWLPTDCKTHHHHRKLKIRKEAITKPLDVKAILHCHCWQVAIIAAWWACQSSWVGKEQGCSLGNLTLSAPAECLSRFSREGKDCNAVSQVVAKALAMCQGIHL